ncbi:hypothetical protein [Agaribacterium sp. ZY112]|uniref:hypothetical protein n=1 Tax=Agaribacterium sp. ZY112 TaxID=3233574 RepID=UPI0035247EB2
MQKTSKTAPSTPASLTHEPSTTEHLKQKAHATAQAMLNESLFYFSGAAVLLSLREELGIYENDPDFAVFCAVVHEAYELGFDGPPEQWSKHARHVQQEQLRSSIDWAKEISLNQCQALMQRYS